MKDAAWVRLQILHTLFTAGGGHYGGALSCVEILMLLMDLIQERQQKKGIRDKFILSKGHAAVTYYTLLARLGEFPEGELSSFGNAGSRLQGHPDMRSLASIDFTTGSLGQGLSVGCGLAWSNRNDSRHIWTLLGDGECQEGQVWEAAQWAARSKLSNLTAIVDLNKHQEWGFRGEQTDPLQKAREKWEAFGWNVFECDGHNEHLLAEILNTCAIGTGPSVVLAHTVKGKGVRLIEAEPDRFHCGSLTPEEYKNAIEEITNDSFSCSCGRQA